MIKQTTPNIFFLTLTILITIFMLSILYLPSQTSFAHHVVKEIAVTERPMKISLDEPLLFVSNLGQPVVSIISTVSDKVVGTINTTQGVIDVEGVNDNNKVLYIANYNTDEIIVIDTKNNDTIVKTIQVSAHPIDVKVDPVTNQVLVTSFASKKLTFISGDTNEITGTIDTGISPWGIGIDNGKHLAYIGHHNSSYIAVVDILSKKVIKQIPIGFEGQSVAVDTDEHKIYVSFHDIDKVVKINGNNNEIETVIELDGRTPNDIAVDSISHKLYASIKSSNNLFVMGPESYALSVPVVTQEPPILFVDNIIVHGQDVQILNPVLMDTTAAGEKYSFISPYLTSAAILDSENKSLSMQVTSSDGGDLQIKIPKTILDIIIEGDRNMTVLVGGEKTEFKEIPSSLSDQQLQQKDLSKEILVFIPKGDRKVEITGKIIS